MNTTFEKPKNVEEWDPPLGKRPHLNYDETERQQKIQEVIERSRQRAAAAIRKHGIRE